MSEKEIQEEVYVEEQQVQREYKVNYKFFKRQFRVLALGLGWPTENPLLWFLILLSFGFQITGGYIAQMHFYYTATGRGSGDPGIVGCLASGCGTPKVPAPGNKAIVESYMSKFAWTFFILITCVIGFCVTGDVICTLLRKRTNQILHNRLLKGNNLYRLRLDGRVDNWDQRITSDLQAMLDGLCCALFGNTSDFAAYPVGYCLSRMSFAFYNVLNGLTVGRSLGIVGSVMLMTLLATIGYIFPMNMICGLFYQGQHYEGDLRFTHTRAISHCESISFYDGEEREMQVAEKQYKRIYYNQRRYYQWQGVLMILRLFVTVSQPAVGYMMLAIAGTDNSSSASAFIKQIGSVLEYLLFLPSIMATWSFAAGACHRVGKLMEVVDEIEKESEQISYTVIEDEEVIQIDGLYMRPPIPKQDKKKKLGFFQRKFSTFGLLNSSKPPPSPFSSENSNQTPLLFDNLSLFISAGRSVVIMGPSGCGKTSLLRVLGGLWAPEQGTIRRPVKVGPGGVLFLPQKPYVFAGTLLQQISYPFEATNMNIEEITKLLGNVNLSHLIKKWGHDEIVDWGSVLSVGERQRLSFLRVFYQKPRWALMDEATSAMDPAMEYYCLDKCRNMGITMVSVAHRPTVIQHHDMVFKMSGEDKQTCMMTVADYLNGEDHSHVHVVVEEEDMVHEKPISGIPLEEEGLNCNFWRRLGFSFKQMFQRYSTNVIVFSIIMFLLMGLNGAMYIIIFKWYGTSKIVADVIAGRTGNALKDSLVIVALNFVGCICQSGSAFLGAMMALYMQRALMNYIHGRYFYRKVIYAVNKVEKDVEGIDQRVVQDLSGLRETYAWIIGSPFAYLQFRTGFLPHMVTFIIMISYAYSINWALTTFFMIFVVLLAIFQLISSSITSKATIKRQEEEGYLRQHYGQLRLYLESITFYNGQATEAAIAERLLDNVVAAKLRYVLLASLTTAPTVITYYWLQNGDYVMAAIIQLYTNFRFPVADTLTVIAYILLCGKQVDQLIKCLGGFGQLGGYTHRVMVATETIDKYQHYADNIEEHIAQASQIEFNSVTVSPPNSQRILIKDLNCIVERGDSMVINGPSGCGKSSLLRVLAGLWQAQSGTIYRPGVSCENGIYFLPQVSYLTEGSLLQQVIYPHESNEKANDDFIKQVLQEAGLGYLVAKYGLHKPTPWEDLLSGGEAQRIGFARLFFHSPAYAIMDESTSALDMDLEARLLNTCIQKNITLMSVAHRPSVAKFHRKALVLDGKGGYEIKSVKLE